MNLSLSCLVTFKKYAPNQKARFILLFFFFFFAPLLCFPSSSWWGVVRFSVLERESGNVGVIFIVTFVFEVELVAFLFGGIFVGHYFKKVLFDCGGLQCLFFLAILDESLYSCKILLKSIFEPHLMRCLLIFRQTCCLEDSVVVQLQLFITEVWVAYDDVQRCVSVVVNLAAHQECEHNGRVGFLGGEVVCVWSCGGGVGCIPKRIWTSASRSPQSRWCRCRTVQDTRGSSY